MSSPFPLDITVELFYDSVWNDITADVRQTVDITHKWGRGNETAEVPPRSLELLLNNGTSKVNSAVSGRYSPRNPRSDLFGKIGRNTPIRVRLGARRGALYLPGFQGVFVSTPDDASLDITGDIDARMEVEPKSWRPVSDTDGAGHTALVRKNHLTGNQQSWSWWIVPDGTLRIRWSPDGAAFITKSSTVAVPEASGRLAIRFTIDVDNGASGNDVKFFTAPAIGDVWTQLGATVTTAGTTSLFASTAQIEIGQLFSDASPGITTDNFVGLVHAFELRNGIDGTLVAAPDFSGHEPMDTSFVDSEGLTWTINGTGAHFPDPSIRYGEVTTWPVQWDLSGNDVWVSITAKGILQRLNQGQSPLRSAMFRDLSTASNIVQYWPCEDDVDSTVIAPGVGTNRLGVNGDVTLAAYDGLKGSAPLPQFGTGTFNGSTTPFADDNNQRLLAFVHPPDGGTPGQRRILSGFMSGSTVREWRLQILDTGVLRLLAFDGDDNVLLDDTSATNRNGTNFLTWIWLERVGADVNWQYGGLKEGDTVALVRNGTLTGKTISQFRGIVVGSGLEMNDCAIGHVALMTGDVHGPFWATASSSLIAWTGETAGDRVIRLCEEEGIPLQVVGRPAESELMGAQLIDTLLTLLRECAATDLAVLGDAVDSGALRWRGRTDLYNQDTALTLDYSAGQVGDALDPVEDDQTIRNDVTAKRKGGSSAQAVRDTGPLNVVLPEDDSEGVGRYDSSVELSLHSDGQLPEQAGWRLHLGTVDEARYPRIGVNLGATPALSDAATAVETGDRVQVTNPPDWLPGETIDQLAQGGAETLGPFIHKIAYTCTPASPWSVAVVGDDTLGKADTEDSSTTASFVSGTDTSLSVATNRGPIWTTVAAQFPFEVKVSGVVLNVTAITGATSPQTFTVDQTPVNGVNKTIPAGSALSLAQPAVIAL